MTPSAFTIAVAILCNTATAAPLGTYESPCECRDNHGKHRWAEKNDPALLPTDASAIQAVTPSDIFNWQGPTEYLVPSSERIWSEQKWYALTGRVRGGWRSSSAWLGLDVRIHVNHDRSAEIERVMRLPWHKSLTLCGIRSQK